MKIHGCDTNNARVIGRTGNKPDFLCISIDFCSLKAPFQISSSHRCFECRKTAIPTNNNGINAFPNVLHDPHHAVRIHLFAEQVLGYFIFVNGGIVICDAHIFQLLQQARIGTENKWSLCVQNPLQIPCAREACRDDMALRQFFHAFLVQLFIVWYSANIEFVMLSQLAKEHSTRMSAIICCENDLSTWLCNQFVDLGGNHLSNAICFNLNVLVL
mmetsp:Transcript_115954/g.217083  ORF Transcript_115954/g.217083 Transcript_115954/m.217083 type:complete len:215 (+) Transcript_115954:90-734(+)